MTVTRAPGSQRDPQFIQQLMPVWEWFYRYYFRVQTQGWDHIPPEGQLLFVVPTMAGWLLLICRCSCTIGFGALGTERTATASPTPRSGGFILDGRLSR